MPSTGTGQRPSLPEAPLRIAAIAVGGALGTLARYGTDRALVASSTGFPWATFAVNVTGSFVLGLVVTLVVERWPPTRFVRPFAAIGFCGGFTTFSTLAVEAVQRAQHGHDALAAGYVLASLAAGVVAATLGMAVARGRLLPVPRDRPVPDPDDLGTLGPGAGPGGAPT
jgi:CrcB protein